jgi:hypothetical protein
MVQSPLALWGLLALFIPVAIHLLSKSRAQLVPFAHLALITVKTSPRLRQLRLTQWLLLLLRMLLLLIATLLLAELYWQSPQGSNNSHILLTEDWLNHANDVERNQLVVQSPSTNLTLLGRPNRVLTSQQITQWQKSKLRSNPMNIWEKVADYSAGLSPQAQVTVYSTDRLSQFLGNKQPIANNVNWQIKPLELNDKEMSIQSSVLVLFDETSAQTLPYLKAAFEALKTDKQIELTVQYQDNSKLTDNQTAEVIINLSHELLPDWLLSQQARLFTLEQLTGFEQADFPFVLFDLLFNGQKQAWYFQSARLSEQQITETTADNRELQITAKLVSPHAQPLHLWLILLLVSVFAAERLLSEWRPLNKKIAVDN